MSTWFLLRKKKSPVKAWTLLRLESGARLDPSARPYLFLFPSAIFPLPLYSRSSLLARLYLLSTAAPSPQPTTPSLSAAPPPPPPTGGTPPSLPPSSLATAQGGEQRPPSTGDALPPAGGALSSATSLSSPAQWRQPLPLVPRRQHPPCGARWGARQAATTSGQRRACL